MPLPQVISSFSTMLYVAISCAFLGVPTHASYHNTLRAGVLGVPGSNEAHLYRTIADKLINTTDSYCRLQFEELNYDRSTSTTVYESLIYAREQFMNKSIGIAVGPFIQVFASTSYVIEKQLHLLTSVPGPNADLMDSSKVVSILPEYRTLASGIAELVKRLGWTDVAFLAQDDFSPVLTLNQKGINVWPIRLPNALTANDGNNNNTDNSSSTSSSSSSSHEGSELHRNLIALRQSEKDKFILHTDNRQLVLQVLKAAQNLHLLHRTKDWLITYPDFRDVASGNTALYGLQLLHEDRLPPNISEHMNGRLSRLNMGLAVDVVGLLRHILSIEARDCSRPKLREEYLITAEKVKWQIQNKTNPYNGALGRYIWDADTNRRTGFTMDILRYKRGFTKLGEMRFNSDIPTIVMDSKNWTNRTDGEWEEGDGYVFPEEIVLWVATKQIDPFVIRKGDSYVGFSHDLLTEIGKKCGFRFRLFEVEDYIKPNGEFVNGMVHALISGNASMAVGAMEVTSERQKVISFSYTILSSTASILTKKARGQISLFQFMSPFSTQLWLMILLFINVATFSLYVMSRFDPTQLGSATRFDLKESLWYGWNIILQGTTDYSPSTTSMRAIIAFFWFCVVIIDAAYTANLAAFRTLQQIDNRIKNLHDLASQTEIMYCVEKGSDIMHFFQTRYEDPYERMWAFMKLNEDQALLTNTTEIVEMVKDGRMAFIADGVTNEYYVKQHCGIESIEQNFGKKDFSLGFPKGAPYLDDINKALLQLKEDGVLDTLKEKWWMMGKTCKEESDTISIGQKATAELELTSMTGIFIVLGFSVVLALIVGVVEACVKASKKRKDRKQKGGNNGEAGKGGGDEDAQAEPLELDGTVVENYYTFN